MNNEVPKTREAMIQRELFEQVNPQSTPGDMLQRWPSNDIENQDTAQFQHAIEYTIIGWPERYRRHVNLGDRINEHMHGIDARSKQLAIEATKAIVPQLPKEEKKKGFLGLF